MYINVVQFLMKWFQIYAYWHDMSESSWMIALGWGRLETCFFFLFLREFVRPQPSRHVPYFLREVILSHAIWLCSKRIFFPWKKIDVFVVWIKKSPGFVSFRVVFLANNGPHFGQGAVGSDFKIDASYISPNVGIPSGHTAGDFHRVKQ